MAIHLGDIVYKIASEQGEKLAQQAIAKASGNAPVDSGRLAGSIRSIRMGKYSWLITTNANGDNGFAYPARIEMGEAVYPTKSKRGIYFHGKWHKSARASSKSHFMKNTMSSLHI